MWSLGNYAEIARLLEPAADELVRACGILAGDRVLDVAAGNGNVAIRAARAGALVVASDLTPAMLEQGRERSERQGLAVEWTEADAEALPFPDASFDCVTSAFGAMFAPRPERVASELFRVLRPGGTAGMANWTPEGVMGEMFAIGREYQPLPRGVEPGTDWGRPGTVAARLEGLAGGLRCERRALPFRFPSAEAMLDHFDENAGPSCAARESLPDGSRAEMRSRVLELLGGRNSGDGESLRIDAEYLLVVARKPRSP